MAKLSLSAFTSFFRALPGVLRKLPWRWLALSAILFFLFFSIRFPYEKIVKKYLIAAGQKNGWQIDYAGVQYRFPRTVQVRELHLVSRDGTKVSLFDSEVQFNPSLIFLKEAKVSWSASGVRFSRGELFVRGNIRLNLDLTGVFDGFSKIQGESSLALKMVDISDLQKILAGSLTGKNAMLGELLQSKLPARLAFQKIDLNLKWQSKKIDIMVGDFLGKEIEGRLSGSLVPQGDQPNQVILNLVLQLSAGSPLLQQFATELSLLKSMKLQDEKGDIVLPVKGTLAKPQVSLPVSP